jgi:hypothetical protein
MEEEATGARREVARVRATLAAVDDDRWFGTIQSDLGDAVRDGDQVVVRLLSGLEGIAEVVIDLTGSAPVIRLRGIGRSPV